MAKYIHLSQNLSLNPGDIFDNTNWESSWYFGHKYACLPNASLPAGIDGLLAQLRTALSLIGTEVQVNSVLTQLQTTLVSGKQKTELLKEILFEDVRKTINPDAPSRYKCLFLSTESLSLKDICSKYKFQKNDSRQFYLIEDCAPTNSTFSADPDHLECNTKSTEEIKKYAKKYWLGEKSGDVQEVLAIGKFAVLKKLDWPS